MWRHIASSGRMGSGGEVLSITSVKATCKILGGLKYSLETAAADSTDDRDRLYTRDELSAF